MVPIDPHLMADAIRFLSIDAMPSRLAAPAAQGAREYPLGVAGRWPAQPVELPLGRAGPQLSPGQEPLARPHPGRPLA